jgi:hypothetical protein
LGDAGLALEAMERVAAEARLLVESAASDAIRRQTRLIEVAGLRLRLRLRNANTVAVSRAVHRVRVPPPATRAYRLLTAAPFRQSAEAFRWVRLAVLSVEGGDQPATQVGAAQSPGAGTNKPARAKKTTAKKAAKKATAKKATTKKAAPGKKRVVKKTAPVKKAAPAKKGAAPTTTQGRSATTGRYTEGAAAKRKDGGKKKPKRQTEDPSTPRRTRSPGPSARNPKGKS